MEYYVSEGSQGCTFGVHKDGETFIQIKYSNGKLGSVSKLEQYNNWNFARWKGQMDVQQCEEDRLPSQLLQYSEENL